jgi:DNA mismatch repair ATPase MutS
MATATRANEEIAQYIEIKTSHQDRLLLFRTGDYYALLFDDAIAASLALGFGLAFCEEVEDLSHARGRGAKVARRDVTRIVTPIERREDAPRRVTGRATRL